MMDDLLVEDYIVRAIEPFRFVINISGPLQSANRVAHTLNQKSIHIAGMNPLNKW